MIHMLDIDHKFFAEVLCDDCCVAGPRVEAERYMDQKARSKAIEAALKQGFLVEEVYGGKRYICSECGKGSSNE